ncbi:MAG: metallopeptidase family protein [Actinomycetaceae bacterium]|nr:metallopeptidase family protein [Actinomycetaceae bacterium]
MSYSRRLHTKRDVHGRGLRGVLTAPGQPAYARRCRPIDTLVPLLVTELAHDFPQVTDIEFAVEDVPPSDPAPWEDGIITARLFRGDRSRPDRIVLYRLPILTGCKTRRELGDEVAHIIVENVAMALHADPYDVAPPHWGLRF